MNLYTFKKTMSIGAFALITLFGFAQNKEQVAKITKDYDLEKLQQMASASEQHYFAELAKATEVAKQRGLPVRYTDDHGTVFELQKLDADGNLIYYKTFNSAAANSTRANWMHNGGGLGLNVEGQGMVAYVWDEGIPRLTHQEYDGAGGTDRVASGDGSTTTSSHGAHVTGTIVASGVTAQAKGMAPQATAFGHNWTNDLAEATTAAANGMLLSNHSYGYGADDISDWWFGAYIQVAREWDVLMHNAPYYLMIASAGNDGANNSANADPNGGFSQYDKMSGDKMAKNSLTVANGNDASISTVDGSLISASRNYSSSEGPADDLRVKPEIMGNGEGVYSTTNSSDSSYGSFSGTSMAAPNVTGSLLLLQQHYNDTNGVFMKAATLKGLAMHTADDIQGAGPDAQTGWGLLNIKKAAETINAVGFQSVITEATLNSGESYSITVQSDNVNSLLASISWTDLPGVANTGTSNDATPALVNDLDIRITQGSNTYFPWKLTAVNANGQADNNVDPFERVDVTGASGTYTITITNKGTLSGGSQNFSLIVTGVSANFTITNNGAEAQAVCNTTTDSATFGFDFQQTGALTTTFSATGLPAGAVATFTPATLNATGTFDAVFSNLSAVAPGIYTIGVTGDDGDDVITVEVTLHVVQADYSAFPQSLDTPTTGTNALGANVALTWIANDNAETYTVDVATDAAFTSIIDTNTTSDLTYTTEGLTDGTVYYWRVQPNNSCAAGNYSNIYSFQTGIEGCMSVTQSTDTAIPDQAMVTSAMHYVDDFTIHDANVTVDYDHTWIGDVKLTLISPAGTRVKLIDVVTCTTETNFNFKFDDEAATAIDCTAGQANYPAVSTYQPVEALSLFNGENSVGTWVLEISDEGTNDIGTVNEWTLELCTSGGSTIAAPSFVNNGIVGTASTTYTILSSDIEATTAAETAAQQIYTLMTPPVYGTLELSGTLLVSGNTFTQDDINTGLVTYTNTETGDFDDEFFVDISNALGGWLSNQDININDGLAIGDFELGELEVWPNPTQGIVNIHINTATNNPVAISLFDIQGRKVFSTTKKATSGTFTNRLDFSAVANGVYLLDIQQGNKKTTKRIVINH